MPAGVFSGIKVADFSWVIVGPLTSRYLADHGATVVRVETTGHPDVLRTSPPFKDWTPGLDRSAYFTNYNAGKYSISLDLNKPKAREIARRLILWADIFLESFGPGIVKRWGLDYESVSRLKPELIYASTTQLGQTGPYAQFRGFGAQGAAVAGFASFTGWPDRPPGGPYGAYTDIASYQYLVIALLLALEYRRRTGKGQYIEQSQVESSLHLLAPAILDYASNGRVATRQGNRDHYAVPHEAFRCQGEDRWCVIAVFSEEEWQRLCQVVGHREWLEDPRFSTFLSRKENEAELNRLLAEWTANHSPEEVFFKLQSAGVPAGMVERAEDLHQDAQLRHRRHFWKLDHPVIGPHSYDAPGFRLSQTPAELRCAAPCIGEHVEYVCTQILGMSDSEFAQLLAEGIFE